VGIEWSGPAEEFVAARRNGRTDLRVLHETKEAPMSSDPPSGAPGCGDVDQRTWNKGVIVATILAAFVIGFIVALAMNTRDGDGAGNRRTNIIITAIIALVALVGLITWFGPTGPQIVDSPPAAQTTTGQGGYPTSPPGRRSNAWR
jgi:hypothetical protein